MAARQARPRTGDQTLVREINLSLIMHQLREHAPISRATLAEITGLNKTTVSSLVQELIANQFIHEVGYDNAGVGRPAMLLELNPNAGCIVSAEIGVDFVYVIRANFAADIDWSKKRTTSAGMSRDEILSIALSAIRDAIDSRDASCGDVLGLSLGVPGLIDEESGNLIFAPNLAWHDVPLARILQDAFPDIAVFVDNEANLAALGEHYFGVAQGCDDVLYVSVGVGLGGGMVRDGQIFRGKAGFAGEFGHITIDPYGRVCNCGNRGCWETLVSQSALFRSVEQAIADGKHSTLTEMTGGDLSQLSLPLVLKAAETGDAVALESLEKMGRYLGLGIAGLINALDPDLVVFGGILSLAADLLLPTVEAELRSRTISWDTHSTQVVRSEHGFDACVMGGVATVLQTILAQPTAAGR